MAHSPHADLSDPQERQRIRRKGLSTIQRLRDRLEAMDDAGRRAYWQRHRDEIAHLDARGLLVPSSICLLPAPLPPASLPTLCQALPVEVVQRIAEQAEQERDAVALGWTGARIEAATRAALRRATSTPSSFVDAFEAVIAERSP